MNQAPRAQETIYFQSVVGKVSYHPAGFVRLAWGSGRASFEALQTYYEQVLELLRSTGTRKMLSDHGQRQPLSGQAQQWLTEQWIPRAIGQAQARYCAIVEGADPLHRLSTQSVVSAAPTGLLFKRFSNVEDAEAWLRSPELSR
ncbi:hypothetical protein [Hymenobacter rubidus]|uniref:hypothetical protein n=1 Tax=Hymenobacter rubidus TaxID=1441626 RepID=UPI00191CEA04|nr:hypothetical protein [Hymenobacter rubidus]